jgi:aubergine-like protein
MKIANYNPGVAFILVNRKINQRLFSHNNKQGVVNPVSGTVVGGEISQSGRFDFFMVPQFVNQGTATPTSFNVIYNTTNLSEDVFYILTQELQLARCSQSSSTSHVRR